jgi:hypothetical protein
MVCIFKNQNLRQPGFALVVTVSLMVLLTVIAVGLLGLSAVSLRSNSLSDAQNEARANARIALMIAIGELQTEMGPDMRVSAKASILDRNPDTEAIDGIDQPHWLASYDSWGAWLNAPYRNPETGQTLDIADTYTAGREPMFRRWLLSLPEGMEENLSAPVNPNGWNESNSVVLVGKGSLGELARSDPRQVTRAYLNSIGDTGRCAWWIGPENHKARIDMAKRPRQLAASEWETSQGDTAEVGVGALDGFGMLDSDDDLGNKLITHNTLRPAGMQEDLVGEHFFDLTAASRGVLASVRTGHLKKDLSLLFEKDKSQLPEPYRLDAGDIREPSIRPMSPEIANKAVLKERHFASWTRMRHFYRMYRQDSDAEAPAWDSRGTDGSPGLKWTGSKPWTDCNLSLVGAPSEGKDTYTRFPILSNLTYILGLKTERITSGGNAGKYDLRYVASPVCVYCESIQRGAARARQEAGDAVLSGTGAQHGRAALSW